MSKRTSLATLNKTITKAAGKAATRPAAPARTTITAVNLPADTLELLRMVAVKRTGQAGSRRPSVSAVLVDLVERHRKDLEAELCGISFSSPPNRHQRLDRKRPRTGEPMETR
jgi:hypothetical protein